LQAAVHGPDGERQDSAARPRVWLLIGEKLGDNAQTREVGAALARRLGWSVEERRVTVLPAWQQAKPFVRASLHHVDRARSDPLGPPWPDLVVGVGRRLSMVELWIRARSRGRTRIALLGRPRRLLRHFDLVVAPAQVRVPARPNVHRLSLPLMRVDTRALAGEVEAWRPRLADVARPLTAVLVGGPTRRQRLDRREARRLLERTRRVARDGSLYVVTSRRTPADVADGLEAELPAGSRLHRFEEGGAANPYRALLGLADRFVVTSDSLSMMVEVARLGRPLAIHGLPGRPPGLPWSSRDDRAIPRLLRERGLAVRLGEPFAPASARAPDELGQVVERLRELVEPAGCPADHDASIW